MPTITTKDGTQIYYKDWGKGQPIVFSHGWPLTADDWDGQMLFFGQRGFRVIAHDRRGHGRSTQTWDGNDMDTYADDLAALIEKLDLKNAITSATPPAAERLPAIIGRHGTKRVAKAVLISAVPPLMLKTDKESHRRAYRGFRRAREPHSLQNRPQFYRDITLPFYGYNRPGAKISEGIREHWWLQGMMGGVKAHYDCIKAFSETDFTEDLKKFDVPTARHAWRRRSDRADRRRGSAVREDSEGRYAEGLSGLSAWNAHDQCGPDQCRSARVHHAKQGSCGLSRIRPSLLPREGRVRSPSWHMLHGRTLP